MEAKHPNTADVYHTFAWKQKPIICNYLKQALTHANTHARTHTRGKRKESLPCQSDSEKQEMKKLNCTKTIHVFFAWYALDKEPNADNNFYKNKSPSSINRLDANKTKREELFWIPHYCLLPCFFLIKFWTTGALGAEPHPPLHF